MNLTSRRRDSHPFTPPPCSLGRVIAIRSC
jgi:hypothetical protein